MAMIRRYAALSKGLESRHRCFGFVTVEEEERTSARKGNLADRIQALPETTSSNFESACQRIFVLTLVCTI